jgi:hypothetical protein
VIKSRALLFFVVVTLPLPFFSSSSSPFQHADSKHPFKKCNLLDFINEMGYFDLVKFVGFNQQSFPFIYKFSCCLAALRTNEVVCERFFSIAGYVSNP